MAVYTLAPKGSLIRKPVASDNSLLAFLVGIVESSRGSATTAGFSTCPSFPWLP